MLQHIHTTIKPIAFSLSFAWYARRRRLPVGPEAEYEAQISKTIPVQHTEADRPCSAFLI